ncbi:MAG: DUF3179 domain-containing protein [Chloroflexi bacterium]|nr:DUF3179 domain-containing protein [Chloroflexota bacterium]
MVDVYFGSMLRRLAGLLVGGLALAACSAPSGEAAPSQPTSAVSTPVATARPALDPADRPRFSVSEWKTNFARHSVPYVEIGEGGPPRDGIPPLDKPRFVSVGEAGAWLKDNEPVVAFTWNGDARAYPLQILIWHEIVNDVVGGQPVLITFCPLCNAAIAFERTLAGVVYDFGTTGKLRYSDLVMWDRQTESWWQQFTGEAIVGDLTGERLNFLPASVIAYADFKQSYPAGKVLSRDTGYSRNYGRNPYTGYDDIASSPFLFDGASDPRLRPMERVVALSLGSVDVAYPYSLLSQMQVVNDSPAGKPIVVFWQRGTSSALDAGSIANSRDIGATGVFERLLNGQRLTFSAGANGFVDDETHSRWNILGQAIEGSLRGQQLTPLLHFNHFWFAWAAFKPNTIIYK